MSPTGRTNTIEAYETIEFLKDRSFKIGSVITTDGDRRTSVLFSGTYVLIDTNHVRLDLAPSQAQPAYKIPMTLLFSIVGDELELPKMITSVVTETTKYRRVK